MKGAAPIDADDVADETGSSERVNPTRDGEPSVGTPLLYKSQLWGERPPIRRGAFWLASTSVARMTRSATTDMKAVVSGPISSGFEKGTSPWFSPVKPFGHRHVGIPHAWVINVVIRHL